MRNTLLVVGGGIIGLAVAREILNQFPERKVLLLEKEPDIATHQTGHNSGVIHSGIYYPAGSDKALCSREGIELLREFSDRHKILRKRLGKVIVATASSELQGLDWLYKQGLANKIPGLRRISSEELKEIEPAVRGLAALHLAEVEIIDFRAVGRALKDEFLAQGGNLVLHRRVSAIRGKPEGVIVQTESGEYEGSYLINCAGLYSDWVARKAGERVSIRIIPFRGEYFLLRPELASKIRGLVYPVPDPELPFLGVHLTPTLKGQVLVGPNAVLALCREGYRWSQVHWGEILDYLVYPGFWRMSFRYWKTGIFETARSLLRPLYAASARKFLPELRASDLLAGGSGVRAQAVDSEGRLLHDFLYTQSRRALHVLNAPSPAATASLAIARKIVKLCPCP